MPARLALLVASPGPLAGVISIVGLLGVFAWIAWRFGPTLLRLGGWFSWWAAWACGTQGGYAYCSAFFLLGTLAWTAGTIWYAGRRGRWPSALSERLFTRLLGRRSPTLQNQLPRVVIPPSRHRSPNPPLSRPRAPKNPNSP